MLPDFANCLSALSWRVECDLLSPMMSFVSALQRVRHNPSLQRPPARCPSREPPRVQSESVALMLHAQNGLTWHLFWHADKSCQKDFALGEKRDLCQASHKRNDKQEQYKQNGVRKADKQLMGVILIIGSIAGSCSSRIANMLHRRM